VFARLPPSIDSGFHSADGSYVLTDGSVQDFKPDHSELVEILDADVGREAVHILSPINPEANRVPSPGAMGTDREFALAPQWNWVVEVKNSSRQRELRGSKTRA
jgi:hypothetical protein